MLVNPLKDQTHLIWKQLGAKFNSITMKAKEVPDHLRKIKDWYFRCVDDIDPETNVTFYTISNYHA
jgi:hypothetical protein